MSDERDEQTPTEPEVPPTEPNPDEPEQPEGDGEQEQATAPQVPEDLTGVEEDALRELHGQLGEYRTVAREARDVDAVRSTFAEQTRISEELSRRRAEAQRVMNELAELDALDEPALPEAEPALAGAGASAAQLASVRGVQSAATQTPPPPAPARPRAALIAAAGTDIVPAGAEMSYEQLGMAIERSKRGPAGQAILASLPAFDERPEDYPTLLSSDNSTSRNDELIHETVETWLAAAGDRGEAARTAATEVPATGNGWICGPLDIMREIPDAFSTATPVADLFPARPSGRGGWQFTPSGTLADVDGAVNLWDATDQAAVDPANAATWKPCVEFDCPPTQTAVVEAIVQCVTFPITLDMSAPERVRNLNNAVGALRARTHEGRILQRIDQLSHGFVFSGDYGALPTLIEAINSLLPQLNWWNRQEPGRYDVILPPGVLQLLTIDRANRAYGTEMESQDVVAYLTANLEGVRRLVVALDASLGGEPGTFKDPLPPVNNQAGGQYGAVPYLSGGAYRIRLVDASAAIYAESGELNAGVLRDANLVRQNRTGYFTEQFFMLEKHGPQPWATIDVELCADGSRAGLIDPLGCTKS